MTSKVAFTIMDVPAIEQDCKCVKIAGQLEAVKWLQYPRDYQPNIHPLSIADWTKDPYIWLYYVESSEGLLLDDDVLRSTDTKYWNIHDPNRYFLMDMHCEKVLFPSQYPNLRLPTRLGNHYWRLNIATKQFSYIFEKQFYASMELTLKKIDHCRRQINRLILSDQLLRLNRLEILRRKTLFKLLERILRIYLLNSVSELTYLCVSCQDNLQLVSFENLLCKRLEGVRLIEHLACFNAHSLKYLFLWRFVLPNENPLLINYSYITGSGMYIPRPNTKNTFIKSLGLMTHLRLLAVEYSHLADSTGGSLLALLTILKRPHFKLQLLCREDVIPGYTDASKGGGGHDIPDEAWKRVSFACPELYLYLVFHNIRDYDNLRRFITPSMPIREAHYENGIDLKMKQRQDSDLSCFVRHMAFRYASTLVTLSIHQWRFAVFPLRRVFELMPFLVRFHFIGRVQDEVDLRRTLQVIACGVHHKLKHVKIQVQDEIAKPGYWCQVVDSLNREYKDTMSLYNISFCLCIYKS